MVRKSTVLLLHIQALIRVEVHLAARRQPPIDGLYSCRTMLKQVEFLPEDQRQCFWSIRGRKSAVYLNPATASLRLDMVND